MHIPHAFWSFDAAGSFLLLLRKMLLQIPENLTSEHQLLGIIALCIPGDADSITAFDNFEVLMKFIV